jgi:hypothetical protein
MEEAINSNFRTHGPLDNLRKYLTRFATDPRIDTSDRLVAVLIIQEVCTKLTTKYDKIVEDFPNTSDVTRLCMLLDSRCHDPSLDFRRIVITAVCHYSYREDLGEGQEEASNSGVWSKVMGNIDSYGCEESFGWTGSPCLYPNLKKFLRSIYENYQGPHLTKPMFHWNTYDAMISDFTLYVVDYMKKIKIRCKGDVHTMFAHVLNFVVYRMDIDPGVSSIANEVLGVRENEMRYRQFYDACLDDDLLEDDYDSLVMYC